MTGLTRLADLPDVFEYYPKILQDDRGSFCETFQASEFAWHGILVDFVQDNRSISKKGVFRGLHFQKSPSEQGKLVSVAYGAVLDFAVDLRFKSSTYKKVVSVILTAEKANMLYIPPGFAHGFLALEDQTVFTYKCTNYYHREADAGVRWDDPELNLAAHFDKVGFKPEIISDKDKKLPTLAEIEPLLKDMFK